MLVRSRIQTNDDGKETLVQAEVRDGQLAVQGPSGSSTTQLGAMTDISFSKSGDHPRSSTDRQPDGLQPVLKGGL